MKTDFKTSMPSLKAPRGSFEVITVPPLRYLAVSGRDGPYSDAYASALKAIYPVAYKLKFYSKSELARDYVVPPLEALWWAEDMSSFTTQYDPTKWLWTVMLMVPDWLDQTQVGDVIETVRHTSNPARLDDITLRLAPSYTCVQTRHHGPYSDEGPVLQEMHEHFIPAQGFEMCGKHHEIYFNDFRRAKPENLRTILRQPVKRPNAVSPFAE